MLRHIGRIARHLWRRGAADAGPDEEFLLHMELRAADLERGGLAPAAARRRARLEFGSVERYREEAREARGLRHLDELRGDLRYALRSLARTPAFAAAAVLTLALGVAANAAIFSLISATLFRPLPFGDADRLVIAYQTRAGDDGTVREMRWSYAEYAAVRDVVTTIPQLASYYSGDVNLAGANVQPVRVAAEMVSASYHSLLGVRPVVGRTFLSSEDSIPGAAPVVMLSHALWLHAFGGDAGVQGRQVSVNGVAVTIVGVAPRGFRGLTGDADLWLPQAMAPSIYYAGQLTTPQHFLSVVGRLAPGTSPEQAGAELASIGARAADGARRTAGSDDARFTWSGAVVPLNQARRHAGSERAQLVLGGAALFVLLIAVVNLTGLLLARSTGRARETAVRSALGAGRFRLVRQGMVEGAVVGLFGAVIGVLLSVWSVRTLMALAPQRLGGGSPRFADLAAFSEPAVDWRVVAFAGVVALLAGVAAGLVPALRTAPAAIGGVLRQGGRGASAAVGSLRRPTVLSAAAVIQVACALVLLTGAGLLLDGFHRLRSTDPGFQPDGVLTFRVNPPESRYGGAAAAPLLQQILERVESVPGVRYATVSLCPPYSACSTTPLYMEGATSEDDAPIVGRHYVAPDHFRALGIPLLAGRALTEGDRSGAPRVAVINETAARTFWPGEDPIGKRVRFGSGGGFASPDSLTEIVGIAGDVLYAAPGAQVRPDFYTSYLQFTWPYTTIMVRTAGEPMAMVPALRRAVAAVDPQLPIHDVRTMRERSALSLAAERFATVAVFVFAALGLLLAVLGVYGIMAYSVAQRRREIGIRLALGATPRDVLHHVLRQGAALAAAGLAIGAIAALVVRRALPTLMPAAGTADPRVFAAVVLLLLSVATLACYLPARTATRINPVETIGDG